jgi:O-antigen/teichoic acid export membrane protein
MFLNRLQQIDLKLIVQLVVAALFSGVIPLLFEPFFKSNFSPEEYGNYDLFLKLTMIFTLMMTFKTETIISSSKKEKIKEHFNNSIVLSFTTFTIYITIYSLLIFFFPVKPIITIYFGLISALIFSLITITITFLLRQKHRLFISLQKPIRRLVEVLTLIMIVFSVKLPYALELSTIIGLLISLLPLLKKSGLSTYTLKFNIKSQLKLINKSKSILIGEVVNAISLSFLSFFVYLNYTISDLGVLELSFKILSIPQLLICSALAIIIQNNIGKLVSENKSIIINVKSYFFFLLIMSIIFTLTIFYSSDYIVSVFFENQWSQSSKYTLTLLPHLFFFIIFSPLSRVLYALMESKLVRNWQFLKLALIFSSLVFSYMNLTDYLLYYSIVSGLSYTTLIFFIIKGVKNYERSIAE